MPDETLHIPIQRSEKDSGNMLNLIKRVKNELSNKFWIIEKFWELKKL